MEVSVGLHLGERTLSAVEVRAEGGRRVLRRVGRVSLPMELTLDALLSEAAQTTVAGLLRGLFETAGIDGRAVCVSVGGNFSVVKRVPLEVASEAERREQIIWEAGQYLVDPVSEYAVDYHAFGRAAFLVAVRKQTVHACTAVCERAGLGVKRLEVDPLCLFFSALASFEPEAEERADRGGAAVHFGGRWASCISTSGMDLTAVELVRLDRGGRRLRAGADEDRAEGLEAAARALGRRMAGGLVPERRNRPAGRRRVLLSGDCRTAESVNRWWEEIDTLAVALMDPFSQVDSGALPDDQRPLLDQRTVFAVSAGAAYKNL